MNLNLHLLNPSGQNRGSGRFSWLVTVLAVFVMLPITVSAQISGDTTARRMLQEGRVDEALSLIEKELVKRPRDGQLLLLRGAALSSADKRDEAIKVFRQMISDRIEEASAYNNLAVIYAARGDYEAARLALEWAVRSKPDYGTAHHNLGNVYANLAALNYKQALQLDDSDKSLPAKLSRLGDLIGHPTENMAESRPTAGSRDSALARAPTSSRDTPSRISAAKYGDSPQYERLVAPTRSSRISELSDKSTTTRGGTRSLTERQEDALVRANGETESVYARLLRDRQNVAALHSGLPNQPVPVNSDQDRERSSPLPAAGTPTKPSIARPDSTLKAQAEPESVYAQLLAAKQAERTRAQDKTSALMAPRDVGPSSRQPLTIPTTKSPATKVDTSANRSPAAAATLDARSSIEKRDDYRNGNWVAGRLALRL